MIFQIDHNILLIDISSITIFIILSSLSKQLGEALKTPPYYRFFYFGVILIITAIIISSVSVAIKNIFTILPEFSKTLPMALRFISGVLAVFSCMQYWKWLFSEFFKK